MYKGTVSKWEAAVDCMYTLKTSCQALLPDVEYFNLDAVFRIERTSSVALSI